MSRLFPFDFRHHHGLGDLLIVRTRAEAVQAGRDHHLPHQWIEPVMIGWDQWWGFVQPRRWNEPDPNAHLVRTRDGRWRRLTVNPCAPGYISPLFGGPLDRGPAGFLEDVDADYCTGTPTRTLGFAATALLRACVATRGRRDGRYPYLTSDQIRHTIRPFTDRLAHARDLPAHGTDPALVLAAMAGEQSTVGPGGRLHGFLATTMQGADADPHRRMAIDDLERHAARELARPIDPHDLDLPPPARLPARWPTPWSLVRAPITDRSVPWRPPPAKTTLSERRCEMGEQESRAAEQALASVRLEGAEPSEEAKALIGQVAEGQVATDEAIAALAAKYRRQ